MNDGHCYDDSVLDRLTILAAVVLTGFTTLAVQVILPRALHPYFGSTGNVGSAVVATALAGLAIGYYVGGLPGGNPRLRLVAGLVVGGASTLAIASVWTRLDGLAGDAGSARLLLTAGCLTIVPAIGLGSISPLAVQALEQRRADRPSERPALVFGLGTTANVIGGLASGYWLVPFVGLTRSLQALGVLLLATAVGVFVLWRVTAPAGEATADETTEGETTERDYRTERQESDHTEADTGRADVGPSATSEPITASPVAPIGLILLAFYSGVASVAIEVGGTRMLASNFGPTTTLWASVLSVSLGGLAVGYFAGGRCRRDQLNGALVAVVASNSIWLLISAWLMSSFSQSAPTNSLSTILTITIITFFPTFVLFGVESQLVVGIVAAHRTESGPGEVASATGRVFAASTVGGLLGALSGVFFLLPVLGVSTFVRIAAVGYLAIAALVLDQRRVSLAALAGLALVGPLPDWRWRNEPGVLLTQREGRHQTIRVYSDEQTYLRFHLGPTFESEVGIDDRLPRFGYARTILDQVGDATGRRALVVGGAGHALARAFETGGADVVEVEVDPLVAETSDEFFGVIDGDVVIADGRRYISDAPNDSFDIIVIDAFDGPRVTPPHITTVEFYEQVERVLTADGKLYINMIGQTQGPRRGSFEALSSTIAHVFPEAARIGDSGNIVLLAGPGVAARATPVRVTTEPNTDDLNPMEILTNRT